MGDNRTATTDSSRDRQHNGVASVVLVPASGKLGALEYRIPARLSDVRPGSRVLVPLGPRRCMGVVTAVASHGALDDGKLRDIVDQLDPAPLLGRALLALLTWMADYYLAPLSDVLTTALPGVLLQGMPR